MTPNEYRLEVGKILAMLGEVFSATPTDALVDAWVAVMSDEKVTIEELRRAAIKVMGARVYTKMPTPAELLDIIRPQVDHKALAEQQADAVLEAVRRVGPGTWPGFEDETTEHLMRTRWPWQPFASNLQSDDKKWWRRDFVEAYLTTAGTKRLNGGNRGLLEDGS